MLVLKQLTDLYVFRTQPVIQLIVLMDFVAISNVLGRSAKPVGRYPLLGLGNAVM